MDFEDNYIITAKFINSFIKKGKKEKALNFWKELLKRLKEEFNRDINNIEIINRSLLKIRPEFYLIKYKRGRKTFNLPKVITLEKKVSLSIFWFHSSVNKRIEKKIGDRLYKECVDSFKGKGLSLNLKNSFYKLLKADRAYFSLLSKFK